MRSNRIAMLAAAAIASVGTPALARASNEGFGGHIRRKRGSGSLAQHKATGEPHEHSREIARRLRQAARA